MGLSLEEYAAQQVQQGIEQTKEDFTYNRTDNGTARSPLERQQAQTKADQARAFDVYKQYQQNTILTETLDTEIINSSGHRQRKEAAATGNKGTRKKT